MQNNGSYYRTKTSCVYNNNILAHFLFTKIDSKGSALSQLPITQIMGSFVFLTTQPKRTELLCTGLSRCQDNCVQIFENANNFYFI